VQLMPKKYIIVTDITRAFLHADMEGTVHMVPGWEIVVKLEPTFYKRYIWYNQKVRPNVHTN